MYLVALVGLFEGGVRYLYVRTAGDPGLVAGAVIREVKSTDPRLAINGAATVRELIDRDVTQERLGKKLNGGFARRGLLVGTNCLYGVILCCVARRASGIRDGMPAGRQKDGR